MDRNTIIAIVLSVIVITVGMTINMVFFPPEYVDAGTQTTQTVDPASMPSGGAVITAVGEEGDSQPFTVTTQAFEMTFDPAGASVESIRLLNHRESTTGEPVELLVKDSSGRNAFLLYTDESFSDPVDAVFDYAIDDSDDEVVSVVFTRDFESDGSLFQIQKRFAIPKAEEYLFSVNVAMESLDGNPIPIDSYTLGYDPQVGPWFQQLDNSYGEYRRAMYREVDDNNTHNVTSFDNGLSVVDDEQVGWAATNGKYFTVIGVPDQATSYETSFRQTTGDSLISQVNSFYFTRTGISGTSFSDVYRYYTGPKLATFLDLYDVQNNNVFGLGGLMLDEVLDSSSWLGWLQTLLRWVLQFFYRLIPNYGVAIILLTILVKLLIQPISKKGMDSTAKMSALAPKVQELQTKYKDDPQTLNAAMAKLYKDEGISPMGSCLPMLIQFPIFIALYGLLSTHYELRGAMFIPGWIPDLSVPDTVFTLPFNIPFLGNGIHVLPIIYTASMIYSMKVTQATSTQQTGQQGMMKFMTYGMPIIFFFILYNAPSGLILYWTVMNFISILQQMYVNKKKTKKYAQEIQEREEAKINKYKPTKKRK
ncbi:MAG: membrane protein insertase YidC [Spirochaetes bacterium]|uniref:Membrane protein insertase YidC n=1 Tax=Candidatus Aphodenecus pullistercoris TaxID=2840669 RepID=A0A9D9EAP7_9SPIR|nr:membrane protein insertase YidC [Candidatus Aphodenecus pullistercoris]